MAYDLIGASATFNSSGKFGASLNGGRAYVNNALPSGGAFTVSGWVKAAPIGGGGVAVAVGQADAFWIGADGAGKITARYGSSSVGEVGLSNTSVTVSDATWHHVELGVGPSGGYLFVDGVLAASSATSLAAAGAAYTNALEFRSLVSSFGWNGEVDDFAIYTTVQHTTGFTAPTAAVSDSATNLRAVWHFDNDLLDSATAAGDTTPPTALSAAVANATPTYIDITLSEAMDTGFTPAASSVTVSGHTVSALAYTSSTNLRATVTVAFVNGEAARTAAYTQPGTNNARDIAGNLLANFTGLAITNNVGVVSNNALTANVAGVLFSPYNWDIQTSTAKTINAGAYFKTVFGGTTCVLNFDTTGLVAPLPQISYRVDRHGAWTTVPVAASVTITIPADTADYAAKGGHLLEVLVKSMTETQARWSTQATAVKLTGIILDTGKTIVAPPSLPLKAIFYGDSITEGVRTVNSTATDDTDRNDAAQCWSLEVARILGAEAGNVGFGATGFNQGGSGGVPSLPNSYNYLYSGVARSFSTAPDLIVLMEGTNDSGDVTANATAVLNGLLAATSSSTKIIVLQPFNGGHGSQLQAAIAACTTPARCTYVATTGFFTPANSSDSLHPYGTENIVHIAPQVADAVRLILDGAPTLTSRTVSITLGEVAGAAASLAGAKVAFYDETTPDLYTTPRFQTAAETTDSSGVLTFTCNSTLPIGGTGGIVVQLADGRHYNGSVVVS